MEGKCEEIIHERLGHKAISEMKFAKFTFMNIWNEIISLMLNLC